MMDPTESPFEQQVPTVARLVKSVLAALTLAVAVLVLIVLPAEYGIDVTGVGRVLGLTQMHQDTSDPLMTLIDTLSGNDKLDATKVPDAGAPLPLPNRAVYQGAVEPPKSETVTIDLPAGAETEVKAVLHTNKVILYTWRVNTGVAYVDFHGHSPQWVNKEAFVRYEEAKDGLAGSSGSLVAPFDGEHGWYWVNNTKHPIQITLTVSGYYDAIKNYGIGQR